MQYTTFKHLRLPALGMGAMRLPTKEGKIDYEATKEMVAYAMAHGVNYFDTAWGYHGGQSEIVLGNILAEYDRDSFYLASKFPGYDLTNMPKVKEIFEKQLEKCQVEYFDFYLLHNVCEANIDAYLDPAHGIVAYLLEQKKNGRIRHLGFSCHGGIPVLEKLLSVYGEQMEFAQLQLNWLDWEFQHGAEKVALLATHGIPLWVMEPLRGGRLAKLTDSESAALHALRPTETIPGWAFRFLQSVPEVALTLSGMSNMAQLTANITTYETYDPTTDAERDVLLQMGRTITSTVTVPCTGCRYCVDHCPIELPIPRLLEIINEHNFTGNEFRTSMGLRALLAEKQPENCLHCQSCEAVCPQGIRISEVLADFVKKRG